MEFFEEINIYMIIIRLLLYTGQSIHTSMNESKCYHCGKSLHKNCNRALVLSQYIECQYD